MARDTVEHAVTTFPVQADQDVWRLDAVDEHLVSVIDPTSIEADQYRTLRHVVERRHGAKKLIAVTSAVAGDGKTTTALNLAASMALAPDTRILVWDLDLRTPSLANRLGLARQSPGLVDLMLDSSLALEDVVRRHPRIPLSVLPVGQPLTVSYELLKDPRLGELLRAASQQYDYVVIDTPPLVPVPDSLLIADYVEGFIVVVSAHVTPRRLVEDALNQMDPTKVLGLVFNRDDRPFSGYYGYYYGHYSRHSHYHGRGRRRGRRGGGGWASLLDRALDVIRS